MPIWIWAFVLFWGFFVCVFCWVFWGFFVFGFFLSSTQCPLTSWSHWKLLFPWSVHSHNLALLSYNIYQDRLQKSCLLNSPLFTYLRDDLKCYKPPLSKGWTCTYAFPYCWITNFLLFTPVSINCSLTLEKITFFFSKLFQKPFIHPSHFMSCLSVTSPISKLGVHCFPHLLGL